MMKKFKKQIYVNEITDSIIKLINSSEDLETPVIKTILIGDLSLLPAPESIKDFLPAILIEPIEVYRLGKNTYKYEFVIRYLSYYDTTDTLNVREESIRISSLIADALLDFEELDNILHVTNDPNNPSNVFNDRTYRDIGNGKILNSEMSNLQFNSTESEIFKDLKVPVDMTKIGYLVDFIIVRR